MISTEELSFTDSNFQKLEESCIFVDGDELSLFDLDKGKRKLYKVLKFKITFLPRYHDLSALATRLMVWSFLAEEATVCFLSKKEVIKGSRV